MGSLGLQKAHARIEGYSGADSVTLKWMRGDKNKEGVKVELKERSKDEVEE